MIDELALLHVLLAAVAMISCLSVENKRTIRALPRGLWITAILLVPVAGPVAWFFAGRPHPLTRRARWWRVGRPAAPDDDAEFLRSLDQDAGGGREPGRPGPRAHHPDEVDRGPDRRDPEAED